MSYGFPAELQRLIQNELSTGNYANEDEVLLHAMKALRKREESLDQWRSEIQDRIASLDHGEGIALDSEQGLRAFVDDLKVESQQ